MSLLVLCAVGLILRSTAKRYVTAETQRSPRKMLYRVLTRPGVSAVRFCRACPAEAQRSPRKMLYCALERMRHGAIRLVFAILRAPGVSAARLCRACHRRGAVFAEEDTLCCEWRSDATPLRASEGSISCFSLKRVSELLEQHMNEQRSCAAVDHAVAPVGSAVCRCVSPASLC
jgi:hypothetical protein